MLAQAAQDKKAQDVVLLDVSKLVSYADYFLICSGGSNRQVQAMADWLDARGREVGHKPASIEGAASGKWVLMDFGAVLVHLFYAPVRDFYDLEGLWADAPRLTPPAETTSASLDN